MKILLLVFVIEFRQALASILVGLGVVIGGYLSFRWYSLFLILMGRFIKLGLWPFHHWLPCVIGGSNWQGFFWA